MEKEDGTLKGSYTVEAAILCPLVFFSIIFIWYLGFYKHNQILCQAICQEAVYAALEAENNMQDARAAAQRVFAEQKKMLIAAQDVQMDIQIGSRKVEVCMTVKMRFPFRIWKGMQADGIWSLEEETELSLEAPVKIFRRLLRAETVMKGA